jgi:hypothetical protein
LCICVLYCLCSFVCCVSVGVWSVICALCLIVVPMPPGKNPFTVEIIIIIIIIINFSYVPCWYFVRGNLKLKMKSTCLLLWDAVYSGRILPIFRRNILPPSSVSNKQRGVTILTDVLRHSRFSEIFSSIQAETKNWTKNLWIIFKSTMEILYIATVNIVLLHVIYKANFSQKISRNISKIIWQKFLSRIGNWFHYTPFAIGTRVLHHQSLMSSAESYQIIFSTYVYFQHYYSDGKFKHIAR